MRFCFAFILFSLTSFPLLATGPRCDKIEVALHQLSRPARQLKPLNYAQMINEEELKPLFAEIQKAYEKGSDIKKLQYEAMDLQKLQPQPADFAARMQKIEDAYLAAQKEISLINDSYLTKMQAIYLREGIPSQLIKRPDGSLVLKLDFKAPPTKRTAYEFYRRVQKKFGLNEVTLSLKDNAESGFAGFFNPGSKQIDMGPNQGLSMLEDYFNSVSKHESRHSMFSHKRATGDDSLFHTLFYASPKGDLLNADKMYDTFMSTEELYTYSTDMQTLASILTKDYLTDLSKRNQLLNQIAGHHDMFTKIVSCNKNVTADMVASLDELVKKNNRFESMVVNTRDDGFLSLNFIDKLQRRTEIILVSSEEKALGEKLLKTQQRYSNFTNDLLAARLKKEGIVVAELASRQPTAQEMALVQRIQNEIMQSSQVKALAQEVDQDLLPLIKNARENMSQLNRLSTIQLQESEAIGKTLQHMSTKPEAITTELIETLKKQMFKTAKNVKEDYKGFALGQNPRK